ncbi:MAG: ABC transporter substrate-binding protein [Gammaproteobacteria bacterium]|nr:ABC transporter substrate-binding protein [Gammaproteobacteria bacterium]MBQ0840762.1 ABC transporter substrate-binding protein [Gammaproteobacteria bacterium]
MNINSLSPAEKNNLDIGFMRLTDSAPLIIAQEKHFFERFGLTVNLKREVSWANIRDKVAIGSLDAAQMLAPMPLLTSPGIDHCKSPFITGLMLSLNGNAITLAEKISKQLDLPPSDQPDPILAAQRLKKFIETQPRQLTLATVYPYSLHTFQLRHWLQSGGISPDRDIKIIVLPPEQMVDNLARGLIDGFCVGEPWNTVAVQSGIGSTMVSGYQIWNNAPEKILAVTERWHQQNPSTHLRLRLALMEAASWLSDPENRQLAISILARKQYLNLPEHMIKPALLGNFQYSKQSKAVENTDFIVFHRYHAGFPWRSRAEYLLRKNFELQGRTADRNKIYPLIKKVYRTDLYREAAALLGYDCPTDDYKDEGKNNTTYTFSAGIQLGPDLILNGETFSPCLC